jgi:hypothetical protein
MRARLAALLLLTMLPGCLNEARVPAGPVPVSYANPSLISIRDHDLVWEGVEDVISQYFRIDREVPVHLYGDTLTVGRIDTFPTTGATLLEPWDHDSADTYERLESTLQSIRRYAVVKVFPAENGGFWVDVAVYKDLENLRRPEHATAGSSTFRNDISSTPAAPPPKLTNLKQFWIPQGRDAVAEQRILGQILDRFTPNGKPQPVN